MVLPLHRATSSIDLKNISSSYPQLKPSAGVHRPEVTQGKEKPPPEMVFVRCALFEDQRYGMASYNTAAGTQEKEPSVGYKQSTAD